MSEEAKEKGSGKPAHRKKKGKKVKGRESVPARPPHSARVLVSRSTDGLGTECFKKAGVGGGSGRGESGGCVALLAGTVWCGAPPSFGKGHREAGV